jgi:putative ABC transport system ATP-binding protein
MLQLRELQKTFFAGTPNEVRALRGVSLQIDEGSFVTVIGTNGSGKSTLLNAVAGSFFVDGGAIDIAGRDVTRWPEHRRAAMIGRVSKSVQRHRAIDDGGGEPRACRPPRSRPRTGKPAAGTSPG